MLRTRLCSLFGIEFPIIQAGMALFTSSELVAGAAHHPTGSRRPRQREQRPLAPFWGNASAASRVVAACPRFCPRRRRARAADAEPAWHRRGTRRLLGTPSDSVWSVSSNLLVIELVEIGGFEPPTSAMRTPRSPY